MNQILSALNKSLIEAHKEILSFKDKIEESKIDYIFFDKMGMKIIEKFFEHINNNEFVIASNGHWEQNDFFKEDLQDHIIKELRKSLKAIALVKASLEIEDNLSEKELLSFLSKFSSLFKENKITLKLNPLKYCHNCGKRLFIVIDLKDGLIYVDGDECIEKNPKDSFSVNLSFASGKVVILNNFLNILPEDYDDEICEDIRKESESISFSVGIKKHRKELMKRYGEDNMLYICAGQYSPDIIFNESKSEYKVIALGDPDFPKHIISAEDKVIGHISSSLAAICALDYDTFQLYCKQRGVKESSLNPVIIDVGTDLYTFTSHFERSVEEIDNDGLILDFKKQKDNK